MEIRVVVSGGWWQKEKEKKNRFEIYKHKNPFLLQSYFVCVC